MSDDKSLDIMLSRMGGLQSAAYTGDVPTVGARDMPKWLQRQSQEQRAMTYAETEHLANILRGMGVIDAVVIDTFARIQDYAFDRVDQYADPRRRAVMMGFLERLIPEASDDMHQMRQAARDILKSMMTNPFIPPEQKRNFLKRLTGG